MKNLVNNILLVGLVFCLSVASTVSQSVATPAASSTGKAAESNVNYSNGTAAITYPIHTISELDLNLPISLSYQTGGVRVTDVASDVGLGWSLNVGGSIHRSVRGLPDEIDIDKNGTKLRGYLITKGDADYCDDCTNDTEPDIFFYNARGYSGKFILDIKNDNEIIHLNDSDVKITFKTPSNHINLFTLNLPNGETVEIGFDCNQDYGTAYAKDIVITFDDDNDSFFYQYVQTWHITKILSPHKNSIDFHYVGDCNAFSEVPHYDDFSLRPEKIEVAYTSLKEVNYTVCPFVYKDLWPELIVKTRVFTQRLESIESNYCKILFHEGESRLDLNGFYTKSISAIEILIKSSGVWNCLKKYQFSQSYFESTDEGVSDQPGLNTWLPNLAHHLYPDMYRLKLNSIEESSCDGELSYETSFDYHEEKMMPRRMSHSQDLWGYHNGVYENRSLLPKAEFMSDCASTLDLTMSNCLSSSRDVNLDFAKLGALKRINYPNGNFQEYIYESNSINSKFFNENPTPIVFESILCSNSQDDFEIEEIDLKLDMEYALSIMLTTSGCTPSGLGKRNIKIFHKKTSEPSSDYEFKLEFTLNVGPHNLMKFHKNELTTLLGLHPIDLNDLKFVITNNSGGSGYYLANVEAFINEFTPDNKDYDVGGLRIKEIKNKENSVHYDYTWNNIEEIEDQNDPPCVKVKLKICKACPAQVGALTTGGGSGVSCLGNTLDVENNITIPCDFTPELTITYNSFGEECNDNDFTITIEWEDVNSGSIAGYEVFTVEPGEEGTYNSNPSIESNRTYNFKLYSSHMGSQEHLTATANILFNKYQDYDFPNPEVSNSSGKLISVPTNISVKKSYGNYGFQVPPAGLPNCISNDFDVFTLHGNSNVSLQTMNGSHIVYGNVKETIMDGSLGHTLYSYSTTSELFEQHFYKNYLNPLLPIHIYSPATQDVFVEPEFGALKSMTQYDANANIVKQSDYTYSSTKERLKFNKKYFYDNCQEEEVESIGEYYLIKGSFLLNKTVTSQDGVSLVSELSYDPELRHHNPIRTETYNLNTPNITRYSEIKYAHEYGDDDFIDANIISIPFETIFQGGAGGGTRSVYFITDDKLNLGGTFFLDNTGNWQLSTQVLFRNPEGQVTEVQKRSLPHPNKFVYTDGLLTSTKYHNRESTYIYDDLRRLEKKTDPSGIWSSYEYDPLHRLKIAKSKGKPGGPHLVETEHIYTIDPNGPEFLTTTTTFPNSSPAIEDQTTIDEFDDLGRKVKSTNLAYTQSGSDYSTVMLYDKFGRLELSCDPAKGGCDYFKYEASPLSRVIEVKPAGSPKTVTTSYGSNDSWAFGSGPGSFFVNTVTNENGQSASSYTDVFGKKIATKNAMGEATTYQYNDRQQNTKVIPPGALEDDPLLVYEYEFNNLGQLWKKHIPGKSGPNIYTYHPDHDFLIQEDLPNGHTLNYIQDVDYPSFTRQVLLDMEVINTYTPVDIDINSWVEMEEVAILEQGGTLTNKVTSFDAFGKVLIETQEYLDAPTSTFTYTYDDLDNLRTYKNQHGGKTINKTFEYDKGLRPTETIADFPGFGGVKLNAFNYDNRDWMVSKSIADLQKLSYYYNPRGWLKRINSVASTFETIPPECDEPEEPDCDREGTGNHRVAHLQYNENDLSKGNPTNVVVSINNYYTASNGSTYSNDEDIIIPFNGGSTGLYSSYPDDEIFYISSQEESLAYREIVESIISASLVTPTAVQFQELVNLTTAVELYETAAMGGPGNNAPGGIGNYGDGNLFGMEIHYFEGNGELSSLPQYNGNISWMEWRVKEEITQSYGFQYDDLNRLTHATYKGIDQITCQALPDGAYDVEISGYDSRGNIGNITRNGIIAWPNPLQNPIYGQIDNIAMGYEGNILKSITESALDDKGYKSLGGSPKFTNGNQTKDPSFGLDITYNFMNLPTLIDEGDDQMVLVYDANGTKLKMTKTVNSIAEETVYAGEFEYIDGGIKSIYHEEGRVVYESTFPFVQGPKDYIEWHIADHLGNVRVRFADRDNDGSIVVDKEDPLVSEIIGSYHYYPFGMKMEGPWLLQQGDLNKHQYNGIETFDEFASGIGLTTYRIHDAALGRWLQVDPKAQSATRQSPYNSMYNNPIVNADPNGDTPWGVIIGAGVGAVGGFIDGGFSGALKGAAMGAINGAIGMGMGKLGLFADLGGGFGAGLGPQLSLGTDGVGFGFNANLGWGKGGFLAGLNVGASDYFSMTGTGNAGMAGRVGFGLEYRGGSSAGNDDNFKSSGLNLGVATNMFFGGGISQRTGSVNAGYSDWGNARYENDGSWPIPLGDQGDRYRTAGVSFSFRLHKNMKDPITGGLNMFTGDPGPKDARTLDEFGNYKEIGNAYRFGGLYLGYKGARAGWNSEGIRNTFQNKLIHIPKGIPTFKDQGGSGSFYQGYYSTNPYTTW